jgi:hypothetical protein
MNIPIQAHGNGYNHFISYVKSKKYNRWYLFDDDKYTTVTHETAINKTFKGKENALLLFYIKKSQLNEIMADYDIEHIPNFDKIPEEITTEPNSPKHDTTYLDIYNENGKLIFSSSFDKSKFNSAITHVSLKPGVNGTELHIYGVSPKNGKSFEIVYYNNGNRYTFDLYIDGKTATDVTNQNYINAINTYVPKEIYDLVVSGKFQKMDNTPTKLLDDGTDMIIERTELMDYFENNFNIYVSGRNSKFNILQLNKLVSLSDDTHIEEIKSLLPIKNSRYVLTQQDALIILSELFNFDSNDTDI